jgi:hypothetical protein
MMKRRAFLSEFQSLAQGRRRQKAYSKSVAQTTSSYLEDGSVFLILYMGKVGFQEVILRLRAMICEALVDEPFLLVWEIDESSGWKRIE